MIPPYWHDPEWRALLLAGVAEPEDAVRRMMCIDWLQERSEHETAERWRLWQCEESEDGVNYTRVISERWRCTSDEWYQSHPVKQCDLCQRDGYDPACIRCVQDGERVYPCKELAWTLPIRDVVFVDGISEAEAKWMAGNASMTANPATRSELALRFARS